MQKNSIHTVPSKENSWVNVIAGSKKIKSKSKTKKSAETIGRKIAKQAKTEHFIHNKDGKIGEKNSYGNDTFPPRG